MSTPESKEDPMDLTLFLSVIVAVLIIGSSYFLFNDVPRMGKGGVRRRR